MKFSSLHSGSKSDSPQQNATAIQATRLAELRASMLTNAVKQAAVSGVIESTYDRLPDHVKAEYSFKTFVRLVDSERE